MKSKLKFVPDSDRRAGSTRGGAASESGRGATAVTRRTGSATEYGRDGRAALSLETDVTGYRISGGRRPRGKHKKDL